MTNVSFPDFQKLDLRVGKVLSAENVAESNKLIRLTVLFGEEIGERTIFTGMQKWYSPEDFIGKQFQFVCNLEPRKMMGEESQGMLLSADVNDEPRLIEIDSEIPTGSKII